MHNTSAIHLWSKGLVFLLWLGVSGAAGAESETYYDVEVLVFQQLRPADSGERWYPDSRTPPSSSSRANYPSAPLRLSAARDSLSRSASYRPLLHSAWRQQPVTRGDSAARPLYMQGSDGSVLQGSVSVEMGRHLHIAVALDFQPATQRDDMPGMAATPGPVFSIRQRRQVRSKELYYFDHPRFGVLALLTPYSAPPPPPASDPDTAVATPPSTTAAP